MRASWLVALLLLGPGLARADAIGTPPCPDGASGRPNPHHGTGWCAPDPCETDSECATTLRGLGLGADPGPRVCREIGVCYWGDPADQRAIGACERDGAPCAVAGYGEPGECRVRRHCASPLAQPSLRGPPPPDPSREAPPPTMPAAPEEPPAGPPVTPSGACGCSAVAPRSGAFGLLAAGLALLAFRRRV
jgi:hypothetical protein